MYTLNAKTAAATGRGGSISNKLIGSGKGKSREKLIELALAVCAAVFILSILLITVFIFSRGLPLIYKAGVGNFLFSTEWHPANARYGILAMFAGSMAVTFGAMLWAVPLGLITAVFMAEIAPRGAGDLLARMIELLAGIPSVVYGFIGLLVVVPLIREGLGGMGFSVLAGALILGIMILPTIVTISRDSIRAVPKEYKENSLALGATIYQSIWHVVLPAARTGIITAIVLGMGRAVGETMAVVMVTGNAVVVPGSLLDPVRTMTSNIVLEMGYASGDHQAALFATGAVLFTFIVALNLIVNVAAKAGIGYAGK